MLAGEWKPQVDQAEHYHQSTVLAPSGAEDFRGGGDNGEAEEEPSSSSEAKGRPQSAEVKDETGGEEKSGDANEGQTESTEDDCESGDEWTTNRAKEAKRGPVRLEGGVASAPASSFPEQQTLASSGQDIAASREGAKSQAGDTLSSTDTPSSFPPSSDSGGGEGDVLA